MQQESHPATSFFIISCEGDRFFIIEAHHQEEQAMQRMMLYFELGINPPVDYDELDREFPRVSEITEEVYMKLSERPVNGFSNGFSELMLVKTK